MQPRIFPVDPGFTTEYVNWINDAVSATPSAGLDSYRASSDTTSLGFKGHGFNIPFKLTVHYEANRFRIGLGFSFESMSFSKFSPTMFRDKISSFKLQESSGFMSKYFLLAGYSFYRINDVLFTGDLNIGGFNPGGNFSGAEIKTSLFTNVGVTVERELSEYLKVFIRPSYDLKSYSITIPESGSPDLSIRHKMNAWYVSFGFSYAIPELPRCFHKSCQVQINHPHGDREYRSRMHRIWKWQNPHYGQNNPETIKYKGKNKKKINPY
jgi:hypothetical protein